MGFDGGVIGFRMYHVAGRLTRAAWEGFAAHVVPPVDAVGRDPVRGWVTSRHLLDRAIVEDTAIVAGYLFLTLVKVERKIPEALLRAECRMEELALLQANNGGIVKREDRARIRKEVSERLLPAMPPTLTGIPMVYDFNNQALYAGAVSDAQSDAFVAAFREAAGVAAIPVTPETLALSRKRVNARDLAACSFSPAAAGGEGDAVTLGREFLTWLWFFSERLGGLVEVEDEGSFGVAVEGPLRFVREGDGAHETLLRKGMPLVSGEAKAALVGGKKLRSCRLLMARDDASWSWALDADAFVFRGVRLPASRIFDPVSRFQERMLHVESLRRGFLALYDRFLEERSSAAWPKTLAAVAEWISSRPDRW